ncbi:hypothetical protein J7L18_10615 [Candidatus Bathyarchaeota archaeon]|nr:hypothetical protein [Candidatus Bathyarchaeota archaeon]
MKIAFREEFRRKIRLIKQVFERLDRDERLEVVGSYLNWPIMLMAAWKMQVEPETAPFIHTLLYLVETLLILSWKLRKGGEYG